MRICIPVTEDRGLESPVSAHFGSAPLFLLVDTESGASKVIPNRDRHHGHGMCQPLRALAGEVVDGVVVGGLGRGAFDKLRAADLRVYRAAASTVGAALEAFRSGALQEMTPGLLCGHEGGGRHGHGPHGHGACGSGGRRAGPRGL